MFLVLEKATLKDCEKIWDLYYLIDILSEECQHEETRQKLEEAIKIAHPGVMGRVIFGMESIIRNSVLDPESEILELHPDLIPESIEPTELW